MGPSCPPRAFPVVERFVSINGEGACAGQLAAFVRFAGCNLACSWCDTAWANAADCPAELMDIPGILAFVAESPVRCVTLTGGEPLLQEGIGDLLKALVLDGNCRVEVETNGSVPLGPFTALRDGLPPGTRDRISFTMDCKLPGSGMDAFMEAGNYALLDGRDSVKFVIAGEDDLGAAASIIRRHGLQGRCQVFLSPAFGLVEPSLIVDFMKRERLDGARLQLQLHKILWPAAEKGV